MKGLSMRMKMLTVPVLLACLASSAMLAAPAVASDKQADAIKMLSTEKAPALVTVKFILKGEDEQGGDSEEEATGAMIDGSGLVLISSFSLGNNPFASMMGRSSPTPTEIKVLVGDDTQGVDAKLIARDSELHLSWIRIDKAPDKPYTAIDMGANAAVGVGDEVFGVDRMSKFFDRAVTVTPFRISGKTTKPREAMLNATMQGGMGLPVYNIDGKVVGVNTMILPNKDEMEGMAGGGMAGMRNMMAGAIVPAKDIVEATKTALENAAKEPAATEEKKEETPAEKAPETPK
jgi:S1-C subfamily serine protease